MGGAWLSLPATLVDHLPPGVPRCTFAPQRPGCGMATKAARTVSVPVGATPHAVGVLARLAPPLLRGFGLASTSWEPTVRGGCTWPRLGNGWAHGLPRRRVSSGLQTLIVTLATPPAHGRGGEIETASVGAQHEPREGLVITLARAIIASPHYHEESSALWSSAPISSFATFCP